jgi:hypothetical protein
MKKIKDSVKEEPPHIHLLKKTILIPRWIIIPGAILLFLFLIALYITRGIFYHCWWIKC